MLNDSDYFIDKKGYWCANEATVPKMVAWWFFMDIHGNLETVSEILGSINQAIEHQDFHWEYGGNAYIVKIGNGQLELSCQYTEDPPFICDLLTARSLLSLWKKKLS